MTASPRPPATAPAGPATAGDRDASLVDLLDRVLGRGVVLHGEIRLAVADIDLVRVALSVLVASEDTVSGDGNGDGDGTETTP